MKIRTAALFLVMAGMLLPAVAQNSQLPLPSPVEKELAAKASNVTEVTLGKNMLAFAAKFLDGKDPDNAATRHLIEGLDGIYVRDYEFDKEGQYSMDDIQKLRSYFETSDWSPIVRERDKRSGESTDVMMKIVNGETHGMFILDVEPKELSIVLILGPVKMEDLSKLGGIGGLSVLGEIDRDSHKEKGKFEKDKQKDKTKKDGDQ
ncbi:MAG TPA: DUF4252 domain-containing protein [Terracidiphilus sp.]|jgi:hypothetical protein|nr:DUF4252 domain-containing protein [Terracidiphilus sp.]